MKKNKNAFSLIIAMGLVLITSLLAYTILEFIIPFSRDIKGIENSTKSYYMANSGIENGLFFFSTRTDAQLQNESSRSYSSNYDYKYSTISSGLTIPLAGKGNSDFDKDWNTISVGNPIQLSIGYGNFTLLNISDLKVKFRAPIINLIAQTLNTSGEIINRQLVAETDTLNSISGTTFDKTEINGVSITLSTLNGKKLDGSPQSFGTFYGTNCIAGKKCILKLSIINDLKTTTGTVPFLEYQVTTPITTIPLRYSTIEAEGKSTGFVKKLNIRVPQETVSEAFDFTVFQ